MRTGPRSHSWEETRPLRAARLLRRAGPKTQSGTSLAAEITDLPNLAPSTPWWRAACRAPLGWAGSLRAPAGGRGGSEVPTLEACPTRVCVPGRSDLASARAIDDDEPRASDRSTARNRSRHDRVRPRRQSFAADPGGDPNTVYSPVAPDTETSDAAAVGRQLEDDELDECRPSKDEYELRAAVGPGAGDPVARQVEAVDATRARPGLPAATRPAGALARRTRAGSG